MRLITDNGKLKADKGFTLIETLLYTTLAAGLLISVAAFLLITLESRVKNSFIANVNGQGIQTMQFITDYVRNADTITTPLQGATSTTLGLDMGNTTTTIRELNNHIVFSDATSTGVALTTAPLRASNVVFSNLSRDDSEGIIRIEFTLTGNSSSTRQEFQYSQDFISSAALRNN